MKNYVLLFLVICCGCAANRQSEQYTISNIADLNLTSDNHPHGYTKTECFSCHLPQNIHQVDRIHAPSFALAQSLVDQYGLASCSGCHGTNGISQ